MLSYVTSKTRSCNLKNDYCVYAHLIDGVIKYIGEGTVERAYRTKRANHRNWENTFNGKDVEVKILEQNLTKEEASLLEIEYIEKYASTIVNKKTTPVRPLEIKYDEIVKVVYYDESSPTCLRWVNGSKKFKPDDPSGYISKSGYIDITINNKLYRVHRVIWVLIHKEISKDKSIDHISGNRSDNRIANLRLVTSSENSKNRLLAPPADTGLRNIRSVIGKSGLSGFEVVWVSRGKRTQRTFNIRKFGSITSALTSAYEFRDKLISEELLSSRLKTGESSLEECLLNLTDVETTVTCKRTLPKSGMRMIDFQFYKDKPYRFIVRYYSGDKVVSKSFRIGYDIRQALVDAYNFREALITSGMLNQRLKEDELSFDEVLEIVENHTREVSITSGEYVK